MITIKIVPSGKTTTATDIKPRRRAHTRVRPGRASAIAFTASEGAKEAAIGVPHTTTANGSFCGEEALPRVVYQVTASEQYLVERAMAKVRRQTGSSLGGGMRSRPVCLDWMATEFLSGLPFEVSSLKWRQRARGKNRPFWLCPHSDQLETITRAIEKAKSLTGAESDGEALEFIAWCCLRIWRMQDPHDVVGGWLPALGRRSRLSSSRHGKKEARGRETATCGKG